MQMNTFLSFSWTMATVLLNGQNSFFPGKRYPTYGIPTRWKSLRVYGQAQSSYPVKKIQDNKPGKGDDNHFSDMHRVIWWISFPSSGEATNNGCYQNTPTGFTKLSSRGVLQLHNNAWPHIAHTTVSLQNIWLWEIPLHSPYSPDLAPTALHFWPKMQKHPWGL